MMGTRHASGMEMRFNVKGYSRVIAFLDSHDFNHYNNIILKGEAIIHEQHFTTQHSTST
jgi:hypothetical protein